jgi:putative ABC transport system permease protein
MRALFYTLIARLREFVRPAGDGEFDQELEMHLAMAEEEKVRRGMSPDEARRQARLELGGVTQLREAARAARGLPWLETFWLDGKLGLRMVRKSWGLTLVGGLAMAVTIGLGASIFTIWETFAGTSLPLDEGDRVVAIQPFDRGSQRVHRTPLADFRRWRETVKSVEDVSAMRSSERRVVTRNSEASRVSAAEMTASAFRLARVQPLLGRPLIDQDEREGAEPVVVIGYDLWRAGYASDPAVLGQWIHIGDTPHLIVGVMPDGFRFPLRQRLWMPLRTNPIGATPPESDVFVFARLVPGATLARAQAEVVTAGLLTQDARARRTARLEPRIVPYAAGFFPDVHASRWGGSLIFLLGALLLIPPCANIAILVYARTVTRREEFAMRTALGASRARIVMQLFMEVLVLAAGAGFIGFLIARQFTGRLASLIMPGTDPGDLPFWMDLTPSLPTVVCVAGFSLIAAAIAGAAPGLHATGRWRRLAASGLGSRDTGARLGKTWTALLATQVALSLAILPSAAELIWGNFRPALAGPGMPVEEYLTASVTMEGDRSRFETLMVDAISRLTSAPGISGVTASAAGLLQEPAGDIEVEGGKASSHRVRFNSVDGQFFAVFGARFLAGRGFDAGDFGPGRTPVIVNRAFAEAVVGGLDVLGRRVRYRDSEEPARRSPHHEIIGVVDDFPANNDRPTLFHPLTMPVHPVRLTIHAPAGIGPVAGRLAAVVSGLDPQLRLGGLRSFGEIYGPHRFGDHTFGIMLSAAVVVVLLFSMAGIYTLTTFIVTQRRREIGVRSALGAPPRRLLVGIFGRAAVPLLIGAVAGCVAAIGLLSWLPIAEVGGAPIPGVVPGSAAVMIVIALLAVVAPARRAIHIDPTEALRVT